MLLLSSKKQNMKRVILAVIIIPAILFIGCDDKEDGQSSTKELLLYCGAGIRPPADELIETFGREYGIKISPDYAGSEVLLSKIKLIRQGEPEVCAIGRTLKQILEKNNITWEDIQKYLIFQSLTVNEMGMQIRAQALDAVIVWDAIARYCSDYGDEIPVPVENNVISTADIGVLKFTEHQGLAEKFVDFVTS